MKLLPPTAASEIDADEVADTSWFVLDEKLNLKRLVSPPLVGEGESPSIAFLWSVMAPKTNEKLESFFIQHASFLERTVLQVFQNEKNNKKYVLLTWSQSRTDNWKAQTTKKFHLDLGETVAVSEALRKSLLGKTKKNTLFSLKNAALATAAAVTLTAATVGAVKGVQSWQKKHRIRVDDLVRNVNDLKQQLEEKKRELRETEQKQAVLQADKNASDAKIVTLTKQIQNAEETQTKLTKELQEQQTLLSDAEKKKSTSRAKKRQLKLKITDLQDKLKDVDLKWRKAIQDLQQQQDLTEQKLPAVNDYPDIHVLTTRLNEAEAELREKKAQLLQKLQEQKTLLAQAKQREESSVQTQQQKQAESEKKIQELEAEREVLLLQQAELQKQQAEVQQSASLAKKSTENQLRLKLHSQNKAVGRNEKELQQLRAENARLKELENQLESLKLEHDKQIREALEVVRAFDVESDKVLVINQEKEAAREQLLKNDKKIQQLETERDDLLSKRAQHEKKVKELENKLAKTKKTTKQSATLEKELSELRAENASLKEHANKLESAKAEHEKQVIAAFEAQREDLEVKLREEKEAAHEQLQKAHSELMEKFKVLAQEAENKHQPELKEAVEAHVQTFEIEHDLVQLQEDVSLISATTAASSSLTAGRPYYLYQF